MVSHCTVSMAGNNGLHQIFLVHNRHCRLRDVKCLHNLKKIGYSVWYWLSCLVQTLIIYVALSWAILLVFTMTCPDIRVQLTWGLKIFMTSRYSGPTYHYIYVLSHDFCRMFTYTEIILSIKIIVRNIISYPESKYDLFELSKHFM